MKNKQQQIEKLLQKIQHGFQHEDRELLKMVSSSIALAPSLIGLQTIKARKRVILRVLIFAIFIEFIFMVICFFFTLIMLAVKTTYSFHAIQDSLFHFGLLGLVIYFFFKLFSTIALDVRIIWAVTKLDNFEVPTAISRALDKIEEQRAYNYRQSRLNPDFLKEKFAVQRKAMRILGLVITLIMVAILGYCFTLAPTSLYKITTIFPFFLMIGVGMIISPELHKDELKFLYGTESVPFKFYPRLFKACLYLSALLCLLMFLWREGVFQM